MPSDRTPSPPAPRAVADGRPPEVADLLNDVAGRLHEGKPAQALDLITRSRSGSPWAANAAGVCHLRLGDTDRAVQVFRQLTIGGGGLVLRPDAPTVFKANLAAALLAAGNVGGCLDVLAEARDPDHPAVKAVRRAVARWKAGLSFWQRRQWYLGGEPDSPLPADVRLGDL
jgi:hypothetical protein